MRYICGMPTWQAVAVRLLEEPVPKTSFTFNAADHALLRELASLFGTNQTESIRRAMRDTVVRLRRGEPGYWIVSPDMPEPPTSAPSAARARPLRAVAQSPGTR